VTEDEVRETLSRGLEDLPAGRRVLVLIPDGTRHAPIPMLFRLLNEVMGRRTARLDFMIALGTHPAMSEDAIGKLVGMPAAERAARFPKTSIFNHEWDQPEALTRVGSLTAVEVEELTIKMGAFHNESLPDRKSAHQSLLT